MKLGHKYSQQLFQEMGKMLNYKTKKSYLSEVPTDGVWLLEHPMHFGEDLPVAAIEVVVSESLKTVRGSVRTLERTSPLLAIILVHESEITRRVVKSGCEVAKAQQKLSQLYTSIKAEVAKSHQRFEIWNEHSLKHWFDMVESRKLNRSDVYEY